ncbi:MAG TPA: DNRLRE domain-containing protein, partial [Planctomycetota bacterium]|nr:DNRLRE domain-containing protein [Planctomycetota bacterium]
LHLVLGLVLTACLPILVAADPEHVDQTLFPDRDAGLCSGSTDPRGTSDEFQSGFIGDEANKVNEYRILMHFDVSTLKKTPVTSAILRICNKNNTGGTNRKSMQVHQMYRDWDEKSASWWANTKDDAWIVPGGDFLANCDAAASIPPKWSGEEEHYYSFDVTALVQGWQNKSIKNYGLIILHEPGSNNYQRFHSREFASNRPMLWISYSGAITSPDPTVMAANGIAPFPCPPPDYKPHITTKELNAAATKQAFTRQLAAKGGERPYKWDVMPGSKLPDGVTLSETGELSGTCDTPVNAQFKVRVTTVDKKTDSVSLKLVVQGAPGAVAPVEKPGPTDPAKPDPKTPPAKDPKLPNDDG